MLDEIGDMPLLLQTRLLRVLEDKTVMPLGAGRPAPVDFQLICATHCDLVALSASGEFRPDLMFRVNGYEARLPSLRDRANKAALILLCFAELGGSARRINLSPDALAALQTCPCPGNIRELVGMLRTVIALAEDDSEIAESALPERLTFPIALPHHHDKLTAPALADSMPLADMAQQEIRNALRESGGNVTQAATRLGVHRSTVYRDLRRPAS